MIMNNQLTHMPEYGDILYQISEKNLVAIGEHIFRNLWDRMYAHVEEPPKFYTRQECCSILRCSLPTFHSLVNKGLIPISKVGRKTLIPANEFDRIVASGELARYKHHPMKKEGGIAYGN